jgi:hypothetical protein
MVLDATSANQFPSLDDFQENGPQSSNASAA